MCPYTRVLWRRRTQSSCGRQARREGVCEGVRECSMCVSMACSACGVQYTHQNSAERSWTRS